MTLTDDIEQFQKHTAKSSETLEGINDLANKLFECSTDELASLLAEIESLCEQALTEIKYTANCLIEMNKSWGSAPLQHYSNKQRNTNNTTVETVQVEHSPAQSATVSENETTQVEADDLAPLIEQAKELLDNAVGISGNFLSQASKTGKNLQASLMTVTLLTGVVLTETVNFFNENISPLITYSTQQGMPFSGIYKSLKIDEIIDETKKALGINDEIVDGLDMPKDEEEEERKRKITAQSKDDSRGVSSK